MAWKRLVLAGTEGITDIVALETIVIRNALFTVLAALSLLGLPLLLLHASFITGAVLGVGVVALVGRLLSRCGHSEAGALTVVVGCNAAVVLAAAEGRSSEVEVLHIFALTLPFTLFGERERPLLLASLGLAVVGVGLAKLPGFGGGGHPAELGVTVRLVAILAVSLLVMSQLLVFSWARRRTLSTLSQAIDTSNAANRAKSELVARMSQQIHEPIHQMLGMLDRLVETPLDGTEYEHARIAHSSAHSLLHVVTDVLDLSRMESGKLRLHRRPFELRAVLDEVFARVALEAEAKGIALVAELSPEAPPRVVGDPDRVAQVLLNLVDNAVSFTREGHVRVTVRPLTSEGGRETLELAVEDTGVGIPTEAQALIFERFEQVDGSLARSHGGAGLGLTLCRALVGAMGGQIGVQSEPGRGSRFWFTLPCVEPRGSRS